MECSKTDCQLEVKCKGLCNKHYVAEWHARNRERNNARAAAYMFRRNHPGLSERPSGECEICGRMQDRLDVDHDHSCCPPARSCVKCRRGFLCNNCNRGIGHLQDDPEILAKALNYLKERKL